MARPTTPPPSKAPTQPAGSPPTPEVTRRIEENRLRAKAIRDQREAHQRATNTEPTITKSASGFVPTESVHITKPVSGGTKRSHAELSRENPTATGTNRDGRNKGDEEALRPARKFTKFVDYNMSSMTDTKGGFLSTEDDPHNYALGGGKRDDEQRPKNMTIQEWEKQQLIKNLQRNKTGPYEPGLSVLEDPNQRKRCRDCNSFEIDFVWQEVFHLSVCHRCKEKYPEKYSLLTKTECKEDYLLTDPELRDPELLPHLSKPNPHKSHWHDMMLFLRCQVEEYALNTKWGSAEALDAEFARRETQKRTRKESKFKEKLIELKRKTRTDAFRRQAGSLEKTGAKGFGDRIGGGRHVHDWGRTVLNADGMTVKTCADCGMEVEELEL